MKELNCDDALGAYTHVLETFDDSIGRHNHNFEIQDLVVNIPYHRAAYVSLRAFLDELFAREPETLGKGLRKAERAYLRRGDRITKPSYISRVRAYEDYSKRKKFALKIDQIKTVAKNFCEEPNASYHVISVFRPLDLLEKFRPGYVPCVICADFKYRSKKLSAKFFFRSCDAFNLLPFDLFYCINLAEHLLAEISMRHFSGRVELGKLTFWFSRIYVSRFDIGRRTAMLKQIRKFQGQTGQGKKIKLKRRIVSPLRRHAIASANHSEAALFPFLVT